MIAGRYIRPGPETQSSCQLAASARARRLYRIAILPVLPAAGRSPRRPGRPRSRYRRRLGARTRQLYVLHTRRGRGCGPPASSVERFLQPRDHAEARAVRHKDGGMTGSTSSGRRHRTLLAGIVSRLMIEIGSESVYEIKYNKTAAPPRGCIEGSLRKISCPPPRRVLGLIAIADDVVEGFAASARGCTSQGHPESCWKDRSDLHFRRFERP